MLKKLIFLALMFFPVLLLKAEDGDDHENLQDTLKINILNKIAFDYSSRNSFLAEKYGSQALESSQKIGFTKGEAVAYKIIGLACLDQGRYPEALSNLLEGLKVAEESNQVAVKANILNDLGLIYVSLKDYDKAISYYQAAQEIYKAQNDLKHIQVATANLSESYLGLGQLEKAEAMSLALVKDAKQSNNLSALGDSYRNLGNIYFKKDDYAKALEFYKQAIPVYEAFKDDEDRLAVLALIGKTYMRMEDLASARVYTQQTIDQSLRMGYHMIQLNGYQNLSQVDSMAGNYQGALLNYRRFVNMRDSIESAEKALQIEKVKSTFEIASKDKSIQTLVHTKESQDKKLKSKNVLIIFFGVLIFIVIVVSIGLWFFYHQKKEANVRLEAQKVELKTLNSVKDRLFSVISHDLRSPLANLESILGLMENGDLSTEEVVMLASQLTHNVQDTSTMLDNLLQWSKSQMQGIQPKYEKVNMGLMLNDIIYFFRSQAEKKAITIRTFISEPSSTYTDLEMIKLVVRNLLANAIKFTPTGGMINVEIKSTLQNIIVSIKDTGLGISDSQKVRLFGNENFSTNGTHNEKGTGLGLLLCKEYVERNSGRIWVESQLGKGSIFSFSLPLVLDQSTNKPVSPSRFI